MQLVPVIIEYPDTPFEVPYGAQHAAAHMVEDATRIFNRITKKSMKFSRETLLLKAKFDMDPGVRAAVRSTSESWWDAWRVLVHNGLDEHKDVYVVYHANNIRDWSGIGMPASPHQYDGDPDEFAPFDPTIGGIAVNGYGQLQSAMDHDFKGVPYRQSLLYTVHEIGHALGRHHVPDENGIPDPYGPNSWNSVMGYKYNALARGDMRFSPMMALPEEIVTWRSHAVNEEIPERQDDKRPGWADDFILTRHEDMTHIMGKLNAEDRVRLYLGELRAD